MNDRRFNRWPHPGILGYAGARLLTVAAAVVAVLVVTAGVALGGTRGGSKPVTVATLAGSASTDTGTFPNANEEVAIPLDGANAFSFTQPAGAAVEVIVNAVDSAVHHSNPDYLAAFCDGAVVVSADRGPLGVFVDLPDQRGGPGSDSGMAGLAAPATDRTVTLHATVQEMGGDGGCDQASQNEPVADDDWWTVTIRVSVVILQG